MTPGILLRKELRQVVRSHRTVAAAAAVPALMLVFVTFADLVTVRYGFGSHPLYLLTSDHALSATTLLRHYALPVLVTIAALVTPSIMMGDVLLGERERRTLELLVALPVSAGDLVLSKLAAVLLFAAAVAIPLFAVNVALVSAFGYSSPEQVAALAELMIAATAYSATSALLIGVLAGEPRAANIISGLLLGPIVPMEGLILAGVPGIGAITICAVILALLAAGCLLWSWRLLSFERLFGAT